MTRHAPCPAAAALSNALRARIGKVAGAVGYEVIRLCPLFFLLLLFSRSFMKRGSFNIGSGGVPALALASEAEAEAEAGTNNTKAMTPLRVAEAISAQVVRPRRVSGQLQGYTVPGDPATGPQVLLSPHGWMVGSGGDFSIAFEPGGSATLTLDFTAPGDGSPWVDITSVSGVGDLAIAISAAMMAGYGPSGTHGSFVSSVDVTSGVLTFTGSATGAAASAHLDWVRLEGVLPDSEFPFPPVYGTNEGPPSSETDNIILASPEPGHQLRLTSLWLRTAPATTIKFGWWSGGMFTEILERSPSASTPTRVEPSTEDELAAWMTAGPVDAQLMMRFHAVPYGADFYPAVVDLDEVAAM